MSETNQKLKEKYLEVANETKDEKIKNAILKGLKNTNLGIQKIYGIHDENMGFSQVFIEKNDGLVCRNIMTAIKTAQENKTPTPLKDFPDQFSIWEVAQIDEDNGTVIPVKRKVIEVKDLISMYD